MTFILALVQYIKEVQAHMADRKLQKEKERKQAALEARLMQNRLQSLDGEYSLFGKRL